MNIYILIGWLLSSVVYAIFLSFLNKDYKKDIERHIRHEKILLQRIKELNDLLEQNDVVDYSELLDDSEEKL